MIGIYMNSRFLKSEFSPTTLLLIRWIDTCADKIGNNLYRLCGSDDTMAMLEFSSVGVFMNELMKLEQLGLVKFVPSCSVNNISNYEQLSLTELGITLMDDLADFDQTYELDDLSEE